MTIWFLAVREILHRKVNFALSLLSVAIAAASLVATLSALAAHDLETQRLLDRQEQALNVRLQSVDNDIRLAILKLGFSVVVLPKDQKLEDWYAEDYASKFMPEAYAARLAQSGILTVEHLVPRLRSKLRWPERQWTLLVVGTGDDVGKATEATRELPLEVVPRGAVALGHELHTAMKIKVGDSILLCGHAFKVQACLPERGTQDDITAWLNLADAQALLDKPGLINEIHAVASRTAWDDLGQVRAEIIRILPDTQVVEKTASVAAMSAIRKAAEDQGRAALRAAKENRSRLRASWTTASLVLVPLIAIFSTAWMAILMLTNVRDRTDEIGLLGALGYRPAQILALFMARTAVLAVAGGLLGFVAGVGIALPLGAGVRAAVGNGQMAAALGLALLVAGAASWIPARRVAGQDPAVALRKE